MTDDELMELALPFINATGRSPIPARPMLRMFKIVGELARRELERTRND